MTAIGLGTTVAGVRLRFCAMNAAGAWSTAGELRALVRSETGAIVLHTVTVHPFLHPMYRSLHKPGHDKVVGLARELAGADERPVIASIAGATADEYVTLARALAEAGAGIVEANLADPYVAATLAPFEDRRVLRELAERLVAACAVPVALRLPDQLPMPYRQLVGDLVSAHVPVLVVRNDFTHLEKLLLEAGRSIEVIAVG